MLQVKCLTTVEELETISGQWDQLLERSLNNSYSLTWMWLSHWMKVFLKDNQLLCLVVFDDDKLVGIAPLWVERRRQLGLGTLKILKFIGSEAVCGDHVDLIVEPKNAEAICATIWEQLYGPLRKKWDILEYNYVPSDSQVFHALYKQSDKDERCLGAIITGYTICPFIDLPETWESYLKSLNSKKRRALRASSDFMSEAGTLELHFCTTVDSIPAFMQTLIELHRKSWQDRGQKGSFSTERFKQFHSELSKDLLVKGKLFLCNLALNGTPVGSFYGFEHNKVLCFYLPGIDRSAVPKVSVIRVLLGQCLEAAIKRGYTKFDFLRGFEDYKYDWTDKERRELLVTFYNRSFGALVYILGQFFNRYAKQIGKTLLGSRTEAVKRWLGKGISR